jgi:hypothetical protein
MYWLKDKPLCGEACRYKVFAHFACKAENCGLIHTICISNPASQAVTTDPPSYKKLPNSLDEQEGRFTTALSWLNFGSSGGCCEQDYKFSGFIRDGKFLDLLNLYQISNKILCSKQLLRGLRPRWNSENFDLHLWRPRQTDRRTDR